MPKATQSPTGKPAKPHPDYPLFPHATGRWCKKVRGKLHYFGPWADPDGALKRWLATKDYLLAGRTPPANLDGPTVRDLCNRFLSHKQQLLDNGELSPRTFSDYHKVCERIITAFGRERLLADIRPDDFEAFRTALAKTLGKVSLGNEIQRARVVFKFAHDTELVPSPIRYGVGFKRPSRKVLRQERQAKGPRMFEPADLRKLIEAASPQLRAMILLGVNCGFGNADCGTLPVSAVDLTGGWVNYPRPKTAVERRCPLWGETVEAIQVVLVSRDTQDGLLFVTRLGASWHKDVADSPITKEFRKLLDKLGLHRPGLGFYALRHTFETIGGEAGDQIAVNHIMGHADASMSAVYRERISDERLLAVTNYVRRWLFPKAK